MYIRTTPEKGTAPVSAGLVLGGFRLLEMVGAGGMGAVWKAENVKVPRMLRAVKVIRPELSAVPEFRERFLREAEYLDLLQHPNILRVENIGEENGLLFMVMELLSGQGADQLLGGAVPVVGRIVYEAACGVAHAHRNGVIHRDLKPANIFVTDAGQVRVLDFGIARHSAAQSRLTSPDMQQPGSPAYYAPELILGRAASTASDVYALGISLFELLAGRLPFEPDPGVTEGQAMLYFMHHHTTVPLPDIRQFRSELPAALVKIIEQATRKDPAARLPDAQALADALAPYGQVPLPAANARPRSIGAGTPADAPQPIVLLNTPAPIPLVTPAPTWTPADARARAELGLLATHLHTPAPGQKVGTPPQRPAPEPDTWIPEPAHQPDPQELSDEDRRALQSARPWGRRGLIFTLLAAGTLGALLLWRAQSGSTDRAAPAPPAEQRNANPAPLPAPQPPHSEAAPKPRPSDEPTQAGSSAKVSAHVAAEQLAPAGMVVIHAGTLKQGRQPYGSANAFDVPQHAVEVGAFALEKREVTVDDYRAFAQAKQVRPPWPPQLRDFSVIGKLPVVSVSHADAEAYCAWAHPGGRLPTESEWEWAARGPEGRLYPWGNDFRKGCVNGMAGDRGAVQPAGAHRCGATPSGLEDLAGNVWEWTASKPSAYPGATARIPPASAPFFVARGGSFFNTSPNDLTATVRVFLEAPNRFTGFRCAADLAPELR